MNSQPEKKMINGTYIKEKILEIESFYVRTSDRRRNVKCLERK